MSATPYSAMIWAPRDGTVIRVRGLDRIDRLVAWIPGDQRQPTRVDPYVRSFHEYPADGWIDLATEARPEAAPLKWCPVSAEESFGWRGIQSAPRNATRVEVLRAGDAVIGHWAEGGGDDQPRFKGWFGEFVGSPGSGCFPDIGYPLFWRPLPVV